MNNKPRVRHLNRYRELVKILTKHGLGFVADRLGISVGPGVRVRRSRSSALGNYKALGVRLRMVLEELGPTFIKLGQVFSVRRDLIPAEIASELEKLQDKAPPFSFQDVVQQLQRELGKSLEEMFVEFQQEPLAIASIGQVHKARLITGEEVVVKVQRPGIEDLIETDLLVIFDIARLAEKYSPWGRVYSFVDIAEEFAETIRRELDYTLEGRNADRIRSDFSDDPSVYVPKIYWEYTTRRVLTMEAVTGFKLTDPDYLRQQGVEPTKVARQLVAAVLRQILITGTFHADPHPGNVSVTSSGVIVFVDFGMVGRLSDERRAQAQQLVIGLVQKQVDKIVKALLAMGFVSKSANMEALRQDIEKLREKYYFTSLSKIEVKDAINDLMTIANKHGVCLPRDFMLVLRCLGTLEGLVTRLDPDLSLLDAAQPVARELFKGQFGLRNMAASAVSEMLDIARAAVDLPKRLDAFLKLIQSGEAKINIEIAELNAALAKANKAINRLSFSVVLLAFSIIMAALVISSALGVGPTPSLFWRLPILEIGFVIAGAMVFWLVFAILKSGRI